MPMHRVPTTALGLHRRPLIWGAVVALTMLGCEGPAGPPGAPGSNGTSGTNGDPGVQGDPGTDGDDGRSWWFTGPGLQFTVTGASIDGAGVATVNFTITDNGDTPLDREGRWSEGAVSANFVLAWLDDDGAGNPGQYTAYTTRDQTSPITGNTETQAAADSGGSFAEVGQGNGTYTYTFGTTVAVADGTKTHTVAVYASRDFEDQRYIANTTFDFLPAGGDVTVTRDVVTTATCNSCHNPLSIHGGRRRDVKLCITCHTPQSTDPDTGNTVDMPTMIHKIHMGANLPSVQNGDAYQIIGYMQSVHDYSAGHFPQPVNNCAKCHTGTQGDAWKLNPNKPACTACHDRTSFTEPAPVGWTLHAGGAVPDDSCVVCHPASGGVAGIEDVHMRGTLDPSNAVVAVTYDQITSTGPGQLPVLDFTVNVDGAAHDILTTPLERLRFTIAGPSTEIQSYYQVRAQGSGSEGTITALDAANGKFRYTFATPIPPTASGSYGIATEARYSGGNAFNEVLYFGVTDATAVPRRSIADMDKCNNCHKELAFHGGSRKNVDYCAFCHNPNNANDERIARLEGASILAPSVDLKRMIHKLHRGSDLVQPAIYGAFPPPSPANPAGSPFDAGNIHYPGDLRSCAACHTANSYALPLADDVLPSLVQTMTCSEDPVADADDYCTAPFFTATDTYLPPTQSVCTSCHDGIATVGHAEVNTTPSGIETCTTCHAPGSSFDPALWHKLDP